MDDIQRRINLLCARQSTLYQYYCLAHDGKMSINDQKIKRTENNMIDALSKWFSSIAVEFNSDIRGEPCAFSLPNGEATCIFDRTYRLPLKEFYIES